MTFGAGINLDSTRATTLGRHVRSMNVVFSRDTFGGIRRVGLVGSKNFSGQKINFFLAGTSWREIMSIFYCHGDKFAYFGEKSVQFGKKLYILARICTLWRDKTGPGEKNIGVTTHRCVPARKISEMFLTRICIVKNID